MKTLLLLAALVLTGCTMTNPTKFASAMAKDPATVHLRVSSVYGVIEFSRTNPTTNTLPHTISPDGTISVAKP